MKVSCASHLCSLVLLTFCAMPAAGADPEPPPKTGKLSLMTLLPDLTPVSDYRGDLWDRPVLLGDPGGHRQALYDKGIAIDFGLTQVPQGVVSGGKNKEWKYGGSADYYLFLDSGRLDLWPGGLVGIHAESKFGRSVVKGIHPPVLLTRGSRVRAPGGPTVNPVGCVLPRFCPRCSDWPGIREERFSGVR